MAQQSGGVHGTWRTGDRGATWIQVDKNEHPHGLAEIYQSGTNGVLYIAGAYSRLVKSQKIVPDTIQHNAMTCRRLKTELKITDQSGQTGQPVSSPDRFDWFDRLDWFFTQFQ